MAHRITKGLGAAAKLVGVSTGDTLEIDDDKYTVSAVTSTGIVRLEDEDGWEEPWGKAELCERVNNASTVTVRHDV